MVMSFVAPERRLLSASAQKTSGLLQPLRSSAQTASAARSYSCREQIMLNDAKAPVADNAVLSSDGSAPQDKRRAVRRCQLVASAEVTERDAQTRVSARISEIGLGGCYIDTLSPFPAGTLVQIRIIRDGGAFECEAKVVYVQDGFGMGIAFTNIALDQRRLLQNWIADLVAQLK
jgi:hypothetical protein